MVCVYPINGGNKLLDESVQGYSDTFVVSPLQVKGGQMKQTLQILSAVLLIVGLSACSPRTSVTPVSISTVQPAKGEPYYPLATRTGVEEIDGVLDAIGDIQELRTLVQLTATKCTTRDGLGGPPKCLPGEGEGTPVDVLPFLGPEGHFLRNTEINDWQGFDASGIYAIYEVSLGAYSDENYPAGKVAILLVGKENQPAIALQIRDGRIVRVDTILDNSLASLDSILQRDAAKLILAPVPH